jgi:hypothetical protein
MTRNRRTGLPALVSTVSVKSLRALGTPLMAFSNQASSSSELIVGPPMWTVQVLGVAQLAWYAVTVAIWIPSRAMDARPPSGRSASGQRRPSQPDAPGVPG